MSNQAEIDYEKQFQDDLAKATALSLEQQALDDYHRSKKYGGVYGYDRSQSSTSNTSQQDAANYYAQLRSRHYARAGSSAHESTPPPPTLAAPPTQAHRRHSEINTAAVAAVIAASARDTRSKTPPPALPESDLISFSSPTSKDPPMLQQENTPFERLITELQKMQTTNPQTALVPLGPTAATGAPVHYPGYRTAPPTAAIYPATVGQHYAASGAGGMALVPFTPPPAQQQKVPLTNDELQKLYNMPPASSYPHHIGFMPPTHAVPGYYTATQYPQSAPVAAAYAPPQYPATGAYGFQHFHNAMPPAVGAVPSVGPGYYQQTATVPTAATTYPVVSSATSIDSSHVQKSHSTPSVGSGVGGVTNGNSGVSLAASSSATSRRQTPPVRKPRTGNDLIDLTQEDNSRVSVLEAFDPLLNEDDGVWKK